MSDHRLVALFLAAGCLSPATALAAPSAHFWFGGSAGYRHSFSEKAGGFSLGIHLGIAAGRVGFEYSSQIYNDHTFNPPEERIAGHNTNWLDLMVAPVQSEHFRIWIGAGGGLGWVRPPGKATDVNEDGVYLGTLRSTSTGIHEYLRFDIMGGSKAPAMYGVRIGAQHTWQDAYVPSPNHAIDFSLIMAFGN